uniref:Prefoldin subunit 1 n=1 Tax=Zea mays TaxID=4577 RepID=B6TIM1_MAIZE|nr:hypothetical protein [Zea mays]
MATAAAGLAPAKEVVEKKVELLKEIRAHEVAIAELDNLNPSRAVYQKAGNIFFRKSVKSVITTEQKQLDQAKARLSKLPLSLCVHHRRVRLFFGLSLPQ